MFDNKQKSPTLNINHLKQTKFLSPLAAKIFARAVVSPPQPNAPIHIKTNNLVDV